MLPFLHQLLGYAVILSLAVSMAMTFMACSFDPAGFGVGDKGVVVDLTDGISPQEASGIFNSGVLNEDSRSHSIEIDHLPGKVWVEHRTICAKRNSGYSVDGDTTYFGVRARQQVMAPEKELSMGTAFTNGWSLEYLDGDKDHQILGFGTSLHNIHQPSEGELEWDAAGFIMDGNGDNAFQMCQRVASVFWNADAVDIVAWQDDDVSDLTFVQDDSLDGRPPVRPLVGSFEDPVAIPQAVLPRGFAYMWKPKKVWSNASGIPRYHYILNAHNLFQVNFDYGELDVDFNNRHKIKWTSRTLLKDNVPQRDYYAGEVVSVLSGTGISERPIPQSIGGPFTRYPQQPRPCEGLSQTTTYEHSYQIRVPEDYAIPMLKAWNIGFVCDDNQIRQMGAWIKSFRYEDYPNGRGGTLHYTVESVFRDKDGNPGAFYPEYKVHILGFNFR